MSCVFASYPGTLSRFTDRRLFFTSGIVKLCGSSGKAGDYLFGGKTGLLTGFSKSLS
jgi:hypothetical protein